MKFALVSWSKGKDKDALSIVPVNWIVDFDPENSKKEYLIECRSIGGKRPTNGWPVETAHILQLAGKYSAFLYIFFYLVSHGTLLIAIILLRFLHYWPSNVRCRLLASGQ